MMHIPKWTTRWNVFKAICLPARSAWTLKKKIKHRDTELLCFGCCTRKDIWPPTQTRQKTPSLTPSSIVYFLRTPKNSSKTLCIRSIHGIQYAATTNITRSSQTRLRAQKVYTCLQQTAQRWGTPTSDTQCFRAPTYHLYNPPPKKEKARAQALTLKPSLLSPRAALKIYTIRLISKWNSIEPRFGASV